jgi:glutamate 5-kinase
VARIAIKIGAPVLTGADGQADLRPLSYLVESIALSIKNRCQVILITSGAIISGYQVGGLASDFPVELFATGQPGELRQLLRKQVAASVGQPHLMSSYIEHFQMHGLQAAQLLVTRQDLAAQQRYESLVLVTTNLLKLGIVPIFNANDPLSTEELRTSDNNQLAGMLATAFQVERLVIMTDTSGLYAGPEASQPSAVIENLDSLDSGDLTDRPGEPQSPAVRSLLEAARLVTGFGVEVVVANGKDSNAIRGLLVDGEGTGTVIRPRGQRLGHRKSWIAMSAKSRGDVVVSSFLADRLAQRRPGSILLIGVEAVEGSFRPNDVVTVKDLAGRILGRGEVRLAADELRQRLARREGGNDVDHWGVEVIHCDYFVAAPVQKLN